MKIFKICVPFFLLLVGFWSCKSDYVPPFEAINKGGFVRYEVINNGSIDIADPSSVYSADLVAPGLNVASYDLDVTLFRGPDVLGTPNARLTSISSFPTTLNISAQDIANAVGVNVSEITAGDKASVDATVTNAAGETYTADNFTGDLFNPGERQAMRFDVFISCPFVTAEAVGNYLIVTDNFGTTTDPDRLIEAVAGPGENEITFKNLFSHDGNWDVTVIVDPATADATVEQQPAWSCDDLGCPYGDGTVDGGGGFFFSCSGFLTINLTFRVAAGSFGTYLLELQKQ